MTALAVWRSGGRPRRITPRRPVDAAELDALIVGGGSDVDPFHYGAEERPVESSAEASRQARLDWVVGLALSVFRVFFATLGSQDYDPDRDSLEKHLIKYALFHGVPTLGICRGAQLMNVTLGGTLHQHLGHFYTEDTRNIRSILPRKKVLLSPGSRLRGIFMVDSCRVNALHDQSIRDLGDMVVVTAEEGNGIVQAIEKEDHPFFVGVQWHPEYMPQSAQQQALFRALVVQARG